MDGTKMVTRAKQLQNFWAPRDRKFKEWYKLLEMVDELAQEKMESFVGNDPRSAYNLMLHMLDSKIPHRIPSQELTQELVGIASDVEKIFNTAWADIYKRYRRTGRQSWQRSLIGFLLATGWYSVFSHITTDGTRCVADVWNPATVYPAWDIDLVECAHIFPLSAAETKRLAARNGWTMTGAIAGNPTIYDYWRMDDGGRVLNSIAVRNEVVKPETHEMRFKRIPIFTSPVGGLPDEGLMTSSSKSWKEEIGQSLLATNEGIYKTWNKWWTFSLQLLRDTAQAKVKEKSRGKQIVKQEEMSKRGAIFRMAPEEDVSYMVPPPIPVELRASQLDMEAMMQRGGPSWAMFGNIQQQLTAYVMSQIASSANQIAKPYHQGVIDCITDIDNFWLGLMREYGLKPYGLTIPSELPKDIEVTAEYEIRIPGDIIQRATTARMLDPDFRLSPQRVIEELFPEVKNPLEELAKVRAAEAARHPVMAQIGLIEALKEQAALMREAQDITGADLYEKAAEKAESMLGVGEEQPPTGGALPGSRPPGVRPEVIPPEGGAPAPVA